MAVPSTCSPIVTSEEKENTSIHDSSCDNRCCVANTDEKSGLMRWSLVSQFFPSLLSIFPANWKC